MSFLLIIVITHAYVCDAKIMQSLELVLGSFSQISFLKRVYKKKKSSFEYLLRFVLCIPLNSPFQKHLKWGKVFIYYSFTVVLHATFGEHISKHYRAKGGKLAAVSFGLNAGKCREGRSLNGME